eukprot:gnl/TRDRNA2_/TRDRNA2_145727_c0_seq1.p1 gnl/TRDRNA2_/TRDRNA2_145727_c0~~gnl/TRDRNA2_/TRDRNA2_145727_c0_seq1.p1  ORF type:complete len:698 (-),score=81.32 gnl/TRDRNA2_/TRDRNA2_145727_c0_seq1:89-2182(-)
MFPAAPQGVPEGEAESNQAAAWPGMWSRSAKLREFEAYRMRRFFELKDVTCYQWLAVFSFTTIVQLFWSQEVTVTVILTCPIVWFLVCVGLTRKLDVAADRTVVVVGSLAQILTFAAMSMAIMNLSLQQGTELMRHRSYMFLAIGQLRLFESYACMPSWILVTVVFTFWLACWLYFHCLHLDFRLPAMFAAGMWQHGMITWIHLHSVKETWLQLSLTEELRKERRLLKATQLSMQGMLSTLFDASGVCDRNGLMHTCTAQLKELLIGARDAELVGLSLPSFAVTAEDETRIQALLRQAADSTTNSAMTIQASLKSSQPDSSTATLVDTKIYAIVLPGGGTFGTEIQNEETCTDLVASKDLVFVGLQVQPSAPQQQTESQNDQRRVSAARKRRSSPERSLKSPSESGSGQSGQRLTRSEPSSGEPAVHTSPAVSCRLDHQHNDTDELTSPGPNFPECDNQSLCLSATEADDAATEVSLALMPPRNTSSKFHKKYDVAIQTMCICIASQDVECQTEHVPRQHQHVPPRMPGWPPPESSAGRSSLSSSASRPRRELPRPPQDDGPGEPMVSSFDETPAHIRAMTLLWAMKHWNIKRRMSRCCPWHTVLAEAKMLMKDIVKEKRNCEPTWSPLLGWQCRQCSCMISESTLQCSMCFAPRPQYTFENRWMSADASSQDCDFDQFSEFGARSDASSSRPAQFS